MVKQIHAFLRRHMESFVDANGVKHDGPSLYGIKQAESLGRELASYRGFGNVAFYTSPRYRTQIAAQIMAQSAGLEPIYTITPALDTMRRSKACEAAMKAAAIVTDEGGLTCHASIVSRELQIPCVVGTRVVTKTFKDGDIVEVDATKGIITILKKKEEIKKYL